MNFLRRLRNPVNNSRFFDYSLLFLIIFLVGFGLVMLYSVSSYEAMSQFHDAAFYLKRQLRSVLIGLVFMLFFSQVRYTFWKRIAKGAYIFSILLCFAVIVAGTSYNNSQRWLNIGGVSFQPSEFAKIAVIVFLASVLCRIPRQISSFRTVLKVLAYLIPVLIPIAATNLSTAIIIAGIAVIMMFVVSPKYSHFLGLIVAGAGTAGIFTLLAGYRSVRIKAWLHPDQYPNDVYQTLQGLYALGSGGLFGKGLGNSIQKMNYVPEAQNDFIFTIITEELGLFGAIGVLLLFGLLIWRFMVIANNARDLFAALLVIGVMGHIALQVILNIAVVTNTIPNTGITLPFISYGGTSVIMLLAEMGLVLGVSRSIPLHTGENAKESAVHYEH